MAFLGKVIAAVGLYILWTKVHRKKVYYTISSKRG